MPRRRRAIGRPDEPLSDVTPNDTQRTHNDRFILHVVFVSNRAAHQAGLNDQRFEWLPISRVPLRPPKNIRVLNTWDAF